MPKLLSKCRSCEEPIWDGPCTCKAWCKSRVCKVSFVNTMDALIAAEMQASPVLTMDQWYEQVQQGRARERELESVLPGPFSHCSCTWCREVDRRMPAWVGAAARHHYWTNSSPTISDTHV